MDHDDKIVGQIYSRREALRFAAQAGLVLVSGASLFELAEAKAEKKVHIVVSPELTEGPFFVDEKLNRSDLASGTSRASVAKGLPLTLSVSVLRLRNDVLHPLPNVHVDVWHADAAGVYSDESNPMNHENTAHQNWLRGYQVTDSKGGASFKTIFPGWYLGRAPHIHFKVRSYSGAEKVTAEFTSQFFFRDADAKKVYSADPYLGDHDTTNADDNVYNDFQVDGKAAGSLMLLDLVKTPNRAGYMSHFSILVDDSNLRTGSRRRGPGGPPPGGFGSPPPDWGY
jgi:protocatechuate 3,4-dioxygenase beta subunit